MSTLRSFRSRDRVLRTLAVVLVAFLCGCAEPGPDRSQTNVLLVTLDTFRADRVRAYGESEVDTPHLDRLASEGVLFERAFTPVPSTLPSHASILTGLHPLVHGIHDNALYRLEDTATTLAERLRDSGRDTAAFIGAFVLDAQFNLDQGFDVYDAEVDLPLLEGDPSELLEGVVGPRHLWFAQLRSPFQRRANAVTDRAIRWLAARDDGPFFLWVHYFDAHQPYDAPPPFTTVYDPDYAGPMDGHATTYLLAERRARETGAEGPSERDRGHMIARYDGEIAYLDREFGRLLEWLDDSGLLASTLVVVVGDHGESFGEHAQDIWEHNATVYDEVLRVPLIVRSPDGEAAGRRISSQVRTFDVAPTILDWLGLPPLEGVQGESLVPALSRSDAVASRELVFEALRPEQVVARPGSYLGLRDRDQKLVLLLDAQGNVAQRWLLDLEVDPSELSPIEAASPDDANELEERLGARVRALERDAPLPVHGLDDVTSRALEALGYIDE